MGINIIGGAILSVLLTGGVLSQVPADLRVDSLHTAQSVLADAVRYLGGQSAVDQRLSDRDAAIAAGTSLADAGLTDQEFNDLAQQGANVVVDCAGPAGNPSVAEVNAILAQAPGATLIGCGEYNPALPRVAIAEAVGTPIAESGLGAEEQAALVADGYTEVVPCAGAAGLLSAYLSDAGGTGWVCGQ